MSLLQWYTEHKRDLPWRKVKDPYLIWLSEVLLQQTRVQQGLPYYIRFAETFPDVGKLADAEEREILRLWQGLGYYSRARNLHAAAKYIVAHQNGQMPRNYEELKKLKGVGAYTAAAIASFAYDEPVAVVDGNVYRVLARVFGIRTDIASGKGAAEFQQIANTILPENNPGTYNQAIMEFGALHCTPANPKCRDCPLTMICEANKLEIQHLLPVKSKKVNKKIRYFNYIAIRWKDHYLLKRRSGKDIWTGLFEFLLLERSSLHELDQLLAEQKFSAAVTVVQESEVYKHLLTHQTIFARFWLMEASDGKEFERIKRKYDLEAFNLKEIHSLPKPVLINNFLVKNVFD
jgi:A/G-specific adenine glycosylase